MLSEEKIEKLKAMPVRDRCHAQAKAMPWYKHPGTVEPDGSSIDRSLLLIDEELSKANAGMRRALTDKHLPHLTSFEVGIADAWIRCHEALGSLGIVRRSVTVPTGGLDPEVLLSSAKYALWNGWDDECDRIQCCISIIEVGAAALGILLYDNAREKLDFNLTMASPPCGNGGRYDPLPRM